MTTFAGGGSAGGVSSGYKDGTGSTALFAYPAGVSVDSLGIVYVAGYSDYNIRMITPAGKACHVPCKLSYSIGE